MMEKYLRLTFGLPLEGDRLSLLWLVVR